MLLHLARISVIAIALSLVAGAAFLLARPQAPTIITVVVPQAPQAAAAAPTTTIVQPAYHPYWWGSVPYSHYYGTRWH